MKTKKALALAFVFTLVASALMAQGHSGGCSCGKFASTPITWEIDHTQASYQAAAAAEFARWNTIANLFNAGVGDGSAGVNGKNEIVFFSPTTTQSVYGISIDADVFGVTYISPQSAFGNPGFNACPVPSGTSCGTFTETDVIINSGFARGWTPYGPPDFDDNNGPAYYGATAVHELGHSFGLHHNFNNLSTMNYYEDYACLYIGTSDAQAVRANYPNAVKTLSDMAFMPFYYDPTKTQYAGTTPFSASPSSVAVGGTLTLNYMTVENVGNTALNDVRIEFYLSSDATITSGDYKIATAQFNSGGAFNASGYWACPSSGTSAVTMTIPASVPSGTYYVGGRIVYNGSTEDAVTYNNTFVGPTQVTVTGGTSSGSCTASSTVLCIDSTAGDKRFKVTNTFSTSQGGGQSGNGQAISLSSLGITSGGLFWFFQASNPEMLVKVLNGCGVNNRYWVFITAGTNVGMITTVTDTKTNTPKTYTNNDLTAAQPVQDTGAFATCP